MAPTQYDVRVDNHGSIMLLNPLTQAGEAWMDEHLPADALTFGGGIVVEPRYVGDIVNGMREDGLEVWT